jgi:hypothetical protein
MRNFAADVRISSRQPDLTPRKISHPVQTHPEFECRRSFLQSARVCFVCCEELLPKNASAQFDRAQQAVSELKKMKVFLDQNVCGRNAHYSGALVAASLRAYIL